MKCRLIYVSFQHRNGDCAVLETHNDDQHQYHVTHRRHHVGRRAMPLGEATVVEGEVLDVAGGGRKRGGKGNWASRSAPRLRSASGTAPRQPAQHFHNFSVCSKPLSLDLCSPTPASIIHTPSSPLPRLSKHVSHYIDTSPRYESNLDIPGIELPKPPRL